MCIEKWAELEASKPQPQPAAKRTNILPALAPLAAVVIEITAVLFVI